MKKLLTLALAIVVVTIFTGLGAAQDTKAQQRSQAKDAETKQPASGEKRVDKASPQLMKVKVLEVNQKAKTFTVMVKGKAKTLNAPDLKSLPKSGDMVDIAVSDAGGGCTDWYDSHHHLHHCSQ